MRRSSLIIASLFVLLSADLLWTTSLQAKQINFDKQKKDDKVVFNYLYQDGAQRTDEIHFSLKRSEISKSEELLLDNSALDRAASDFILIEGKKTAEKYLFVLQKSFDIGMQAISSSVVKFNSNLGVQAVSLTLKIPENLSLELKLSGDKLIDIKVSSTVPGLQFGRGGEVLVARLNADLSTIVAQANSQLPQGLSFSILRKGNTIKFPLNNEKRAYDTGTRARANQVISKTSARLRSRLDLHKRQQQEVNNFIEATKARARKLLGDTSTKLAMARKDIIADMKIQRSEFYAKHYLLPSKKDAERVLIDYARVANQSVDGLRPVARAFKNSGKGEREKLANALSFFQNIPYNDLTQGKVRGFRGFSPPLEMLAANLGDCDSKSTAMMGLLQTLAPKLKVALFLVPKHAFLGVALPAKKGDATYTYKGITYVLMEPTGPRLRPIGSLLQSSFDHLQAGRIDDIITLH